MGSGTQAGSVLSRRGRSRRYLIIVAAVLVYATVLFLFVYANSGDSGANLGSGPSSAGPSFPAEPTGLTSPAPTALATAPGTVVVTDTLPDTTLTATEPGGIAVRGLPPHDLVVRVTSTSGTIARLGYVIPTSLDHSTADMRDVHSPFVLRTTVYGKPAYAEVFIQTGASGVPVTCAVEVDGTVQTTKTTSGTYGRQLCVG